MSDRTHAEVMEGIGWNAHCWDPTDKVHLDALSRRYCEEFPHAEEKTIAFIKIVEVPDLLTDDDFRTHTGRHPALMLKCARDLEDLAANTIAKTLRFFAEEDEDELYLVFLGSDAHRKYDCLPDLTYGAPQDR